MDRLEAPAQSAMYLSQLQVRNVYFSFDSCDPLYFSPLSDIYSFLSSINSRIGNARMLQDSHILPISNWIRRFRFSSSSCPHKIHGEHTKVVIKTSFWLALSRCTVHLLPTLFSIVIITLNLKGYYIGEQFASLIRSETINLALLQTAAKVQELLIVASLASIIFHITRQELLYGSGLAIGLVGSGLAFSQFGYFISKEFLGSLRYRGGGLRKAGFITCLAVSGIVAALAGPSCAVLLVPEYRQWPAGGTPFYLNGTRDDFWPTVLSYDQKGDQSYCAYDNATRYDVCPSGGFRTLWAHYGHVGSANRKSINASRPYAKELSGTSFYWSVDSPLSQVPPLYSLGSLRQNGVDGSDTFLVQPHGATAIMLQQLTMDWWNALLSKTSRSSNTIDDRVSKSSVQSPITQARCSIPQNLSATDDIVQFPSMVGFPPRFVDPLNFSMNSLNSTPVNHLRFSWVHLPEDTFGLNTIGSVFQSPWSSDSRSRVVIGCTMQSSWVPTMVYTDQYTFWSGWYPWNITFADVYPTYTPPDRLNGSTPPEANGRIAVTDSWLNALTPSTPAEGPGIYPWHPSTIESILVNSGITDGLSQEGAATETKQWELEDASGGGRTTLLESIVCSVLEDGLSRAGTHKVYNAVGKNSDWTLAAYDKTSDFDTAILQNRNALNPPDIPTDVTELRVEMAITGYAYKSSLVKILSMVILFTHLCLALAHTVWILWSKQTSNTWNSFTEIMALAQNSPPALKALENSGAGIDRFSTYAKQARIRVARLPGHAETDHVQMVIDGDDTAPEIHNGNEEDLESIGIENMGATAPVILNRMATYATREGNFRDSRSKHMGDTNVGPAQRAKSPSTWPVMHRPDNSTSSIMSDTESAAPINSATSLLDIVPLKRAAEQQRLVLVDHRYG